MLDLSGYFGDVDVAINGDALMYTVTSNDNTALVTTAVVGQNLTLTFPPNMNGVANLTIRAADVAGAFVDDSFIVTWMRLTTLRSLPMTR